MRTILIALALMAIGRAAAAQQVTGIRILSYGIYRADIAMEKEAPGEKLHQARARNICHVMTTWIVPADEERLFGIAYRIEGATPGAMVEIRRTVRFPDPEGSGPESYATMEGTTRRPIGALSYGGWGIDEHQKPDVWTINLFHRDRKLAELKFTVTADRNFKVVPDANSQCFLVSEAEPRPETRVAGR